MNIGRSDGKTVDNQTSETRWVTHKFGGTSLADASGYRQATSIIAGRGDNQAVVVSAAGGITDGLIRLVDTAGRRDSSWVRQCAELKEHQIGLVSDLLDAGGASDLITRIDHDFHAIADILKASSAMGATLVNAIRVVSGFGEIWSAQALASYLVQIGESATWMDAREVLVVENTEPVPVVDWTESSARLDAWLSEHQQPIVVVTGYIASDDRGSPTTLGRNGSDYSASIFGALLGSSDINIWTDVDGVMTADPSLVAQAQVLAELSYDEAVELAYFGAKVLHPATMAPAIRQQIPVTIRNTFKPDQPGTRVHLSPASRLPVKGFASIEDIALLNLEGTAMIGVPGIAERLFGALRSAGVSVVLISQGSSEHSICFATPENQGEVAKRAVEKAFASEKEHGQLQEVEITSDCVILAAVGDGMSGTPGIAAKFFGALARAGVNIRAIAQGSSERNISVVISSDQATRALRAAHSGFYLSRQTLSIGLVGPGHIGSALLDQMERQLERLRDDYGVDLRVRAIANSTSMIVDDNQIDLASWRERMSGGEHAIPADLDRLVDFVHTDAVPHAAIIDCTASESVAARYGAWLAAGVHVITPNKKANSGEIGYYRELLEHGRRADAHYFYETTVGAALPVIQTLRDLVQTGDVIHRIDGIFSGTLAYLFNRFDGSEPFSSIVSSARDEGYTEPDPRDDLSGMDVARKIVILAREMGMDISLSDVKIEGLVPNGLEFGSTEDFLGNLADHDDAMFQVFEEARRRNEVLRFVGTIDPDLGCSVSLQSLGSDHSLARGRHTDNIVMFRTHRYNTNQLVVQGPGAGPDVTAGGVFADVLRLANYLGSTL
ncbi:MAG TPA: bifunctional aspartate kinase/homoserine dehydrogenase I [Acidimicrobiia bacterium]